MKLTENFQEVISTEVSYQKFTDLQTATLHVFKPPKVASRVEFLSSEKGTNKFSTEKLLQTAAKTFQEGLQDFLMDVLLQNKPRKTKIENSKGKKKFFCNANADVNADADANISKWSVKLQ